MAEQETILATICEYRDYASYVWVDFGYGEELAQALEQYGNKVIRVYGPAGTKPQN